MHDYVRFFGGLLLIVFAGLLEMAAQAATYFSMEWVLIGNWLRSAADFLWSKAMCLD